MTYAIVKISGKQYKVSEGDSFLVDKLPQAKGSEVSFSEVYLLNSDSGVKIGQPLVSGVSVIAIIEDQIKGEKIMVSKFKSKVRYRRKMGFRALLTKIKIKSIETGEQKPKKTIVKETKIKESAKKTKKT